MYIKIPLVRYIVDMRYNLQCPLESKVKSARSRSCWP